MNELEPEDLQTVNDAHCVYVDPNKGNLIYCIDDNNKVFRYTRWQRMHETKRLFAQRTIRRYKRYNALEPIEAEISRFNSKVCRFTQFMDHVNIKNRNNQELFPFYNAEFLRKMKLRTYMDTQRSESSLVNRLKETYSVDSNGVPHNRPIILIYGDCNVGPQMRGIISTPMIGLKRRLAKDFPIISMDEYRTSCLDWKTGLPNQNARITVNNRTRHLHHVLVSKILDVGKGRPRYSFINRDRNSVLNIKKLTKHFLATGTRLRNYDRKVKFPKVHLRVIQTESAGT